MHMVAKLYIVSEYQDMKTWVCCSQGGCKIVKKFPYYHSMDGLFPFTNFFWTGQSTRIAMFDSAGA